LSARQNLTDLHALNKKRISTQDAGKCHPAKAPASDGPRRTFWGMRCDE